MAEKTKEDLKQFFDHELRETFVDKGGFIKDDKMQKLEVYFLKAEYGYTPKFGLSLESDKGKTSFRSEDTETLRKLIVKLSMIYTEMIRQRVDKEILKYDPFFVQDRVHELVRLIRERTLTKVDVK